LNETEFLTYHFQVPSFGSKHTQICTKSSQNLYKSLASTTAYLPSVDLLMYKGKWVQKHLKNQRSELPLSSQQYLFPSFKYLLSSLVD